jgi:hypothetical protein
LAISFRSARTALTPPSTVGASITFPADRPRYADELRRVLEVIIGRLSTTRPT